MPTFTVPPSVAASVNYPAGANSWSGQPCKVSPNASFQSYGWTPDQTIPAEFENYHKYQVNVCLTELQLAHNVKRLASGTKANATFFAYLPNVKRLATFDGANPNGAPYAYANDAARSLAGATSASVKDSLSLVSVAPASNVAAFNTYRAVWVSRTLANQGILHYVGDTLAVTSTYDATIPASVAGWLSVCHDPTTAGIVLLDAVKVTYGFPSAWGAANTFSAGTWHSVAPKVGGTGVWCFAPNRTAYSTNLGSGSTWAEAAATWDGAAGNPPSSASMFAPIWDSSAGRWIVGTADISSSANAASTGKLWVSSNGYTWTTLAATTGFAFVKLARHFGKLWALGICADTGSNPRSHNGLEVFVSSDDGATWTRTGHIVSFGTSTTASDYRLKCDIQPMGQFILFQTGLGTNVEFVILHCGS